MVKLFFSSCFELPGPVIGFEIQFGKKSTELEQIPEVAFEALKHSIRELSTVGYYMVRERAWERD